MEVFTDSLLYCFPVSRRLKAHHYFWVVSQKCNGARRSPRSGRKSKAHGASRGNQLRALGSAREAGERVRPTAWAVRAQRGGAASTAFCRKENPFRNRGIAGAGLDLSPASRADGALATDTHGLRHGLYSSARFAGCALRRYTFGIRATILEDHHSKPEGHARLSWNGRPK